MFPAIIQLYKNAYSSVPKPMWWLALVILVNRAGTMVIPFLTVYLTSKGYSLVQAGMVMAIFGCGGIVGGYLGGVLSDRLGFFSVQVVSLLFNGVLFFLLGRMQTLPQIMSCVFVLSVVGESFRPANAAAVAAYSTEVNRTRSYSLNRLAINLGWAVGPAVGGVLASVSYSLLFVVDGTTCVLAALLLYFSLAAFNKKFHSKRVGQMLSAKSAYKDKIFLWAMFFLFLVGVCFFQLFNLVAAYFNQGLHLKESTIGWLLGLNGLIIVVVEMILVFKLENKRNDLVYILCGASLVGLAYLILSLHKSLLIAITSIIVITFGEMLLFPFINSFWVRRCMANNRGQYAALNTMSFAASLVMAPTIASQIAAHFGFTLLWVVNFILCSIAAIGFNWLRKKMRYE